LCSLPTFSSLSAHHQRQDPIGKRGSEGKKVSEKKGRKKTTPDAVSSTQSYPEWKDFKKKEGKEKKKGGKGVPAAGNGRTRVPLFYRRKRERNTHEKKEEKASR